MRVELGELQADKIKLQTELRSSGIRCSNLQAMVDKQIQPITRLLIAMRGEMCEVCESIAEEALKDFPGISWNW